MFDLACFRGLRVSELVSLTWGQVIRRESGEAQLSIVGKGGKGREVLTALCLERHRLRVVGAVDAVVLPAEQGAIDIGGDLKPSLARDGARARFGPGMTP